MKKRYFHHMRKLSVFILYLGVLLGLLAVNAAAIDPAGTQVTVEVRPSVTIVIDGAERNFFNAAGEQVYTVYYNGTHYLPVRAIGELMGKNVNWDGASKTITLSGPRTAAPVSGTVGDKPRDFNATAQLRPDIRLVVDGTARTFTDAKGNPAYPLLWEGTNYLPVRAIGELMGKRTDWDGGNRRITLTGDELPVTDADTFGPSGSSTGDLIGQEKAKAAAFAHAKVTAEQTASVTCKLDWEKGRRVYEVEFRTASGQEYKYEIDAYTAEILSAEYDAEESVPNSSGSYIGEERARSIAMEKVPGADASHIRKLKLDYDDGRWEYEVEIYYNGIEYEGEIDAVTGKILKWEAERG